MAIAALFNIPGTDEELLQWSFAHAAHHLDIINRIYTTFLIALPSYILDPFDVNNTDSMESWTYRHQLLHQQMDAVLGIAGFDLTDVNWQDQNQRAAWIQLNANEHIQAGQILRIG